MAKHYTLAETAAKLGVSEEQVKSLAKDGKLREVRDAGKLFYRSEEVDRMARKEGSSVLDLSLTDEVEEAGAGGSDVISLEADDEPKKKPGKEDTKITSVGISVFDDEELEIEADPLAETRITPASGEEIGFGSGTGSGSGLMDLTRESDDTSLGAELLDVISPTEAGDTETAEVVEGAETATETAASSGTATAMPEEFAPVEAAPMMAPVVAGPADPLAPLFTGLIVASAIMMTVGGFVAAAALQGVWPGFLAQAAQGTNLYLFVLGGGVGITAICAVVGYVASRSGGPARPAAARVRKR